MSMPVTRAPRWAMASARMPPPQPTSSTSLPARLALSSIQLVRNGLISCSGLNSLSRSHQRLASASNLATSARSTLSVILFPSLSFAELVVAVGWRCGAAGMPCGQCSPGCRALRGASGPACHGRQYTLWPGPLAVTFEHAPGGCRYNDVFCWSSCMPPPRRVPVRPDVPTLEWHDNHLRILDQRCLPETRSWIECRDAADAAAAISDGVVQGASGAGLVAAYGIALVA